MGTVFIFRVDEGLRRWGGTSLRDSTEAPPWCPDHSVQSQHALQSSPAARHCWMMKMTTISTLILFPVWCYEVGDLLMWLIRLKYYDDDGVIVFIGRSDTLFKALSKTSSVVPTHMSFKINTVMPFINVKLELDHIGLQVGYTYETMIVKLVSSYSISWFSSNI